MLSTLLPPPIAEALFEQLEESIAVYAPDGRCLYVNPTTERMFGKARKDLVGRKLWDVFKEARNNLFHQAFERVAATGKPEVFDHFYEPWQRWFSNRICLADGCVWVIATDITETRQAQAAASAQASRLKLLERVSRVASEARLHLQSVLESVASAVVGDLAHSCVVYLLAEDGVRLDVPVVQHVHSEAAEAIRAMSLAAPQRVSEGLVGMVVQKGEPIRIPVVDLRSMRDATKSEFRSYLEAFPFQSYLAVPLRMAGKVMGAVAVVRHAPGPPFDAEDEGTLQEVADRLALSMQNARLYESEQRAAARLGLLAELSQTLSEAQPDLQGVLQIVCQEVAKCITDSCTINLLSPLTQTLELVATYHWNPAVSESMGQTLAREPVPVDFGVLGRVMQSGQALLIPTVSMAQLMDRVPPLYREHLRRFPLTSLLIVPLRIGEEILGTVTLSRDAGGAAYTLEDQQLLTDLADRSALAIGRAQRFQELQTGILEEKRVREERELLLQREREARARLAVLSHVSQVLASSLDYETTLRNVVTLAQPMLGDFGFFDLIEPNGQVRRIATAFEDPRRQSLLEQTQWMRSDRRDLNLCAVSSGQLGLHPRVDDAWLQKIAQSPEHLALLRDLDFCSMMTVPLSYRGRTLGALTLFYGDSKRQHRSEDILLAEELAMRASAAVENARLFKETQDAIGIRDDFLSVAGHELRTPLTALQLQLMSVVRMLQARPGAQDILLRAERATRSLNRFGALVNELLDNSHISSGKLSLEKTTFDLAELTREVLDRSSEELSRAGCALTFRASGRAVGTWDHIRLEQVLNNLLSNAMKYGSGKPIQVAVDSDGIHARLSVKDGGIGISPEDQKRIFQRFERAVPSRHFGGLGLGLWVSLQLAEAHGGSLRVESAAQEGALFVMELPLFHAER